MLVDEEQSREAILVLRFSSLGDILLTAPAIRALHRRFPDARIDLLVAEEFRDAAELIPGVDSILTFDRRAGFAELLRIRADISRQYAILVDLQNSLRSAFLRLLAFPTIWVKARRFRVHRWLLIRTKHVFYSRVLPVPDRYLSALETFGITDDGRGLELRRQLGGGEAPIADKSVVLCPGAKHFTKRWPAERWIELGRRLRSLNFAVTLIGSESERATIQQLSTQIPDARVCVGVPFKRVAATMQNADCVVSNDSGLMHLATGLDVPVVALFGPTVDWFGFFPYRARAEVIQNSLPCRPCSAFGGPSCPKRHFRCMLDTQADRVADAVVRSVAPFATSAH